LGGYLGSFVGDDTASTRLSESKKKKSCHRNFPRLVVNTSNFEMTGLGSMNTPVLDEQAG
jgi:hypothetical protein